MNDQPSLVEKVLVFVIVVCATVMALLVTTKLVKAGLTALGRCT